MFLTEKEVFDLTHKKNRSAQVRALRSMGIEHKVRPDGSVAVARGYIEKLLAGNTVENDRIKKKSEPNWSAINA